MKIIKIICTGSKDNVLKTYINEYSLEIRTVINDKRKAYLIINEKLVG